VIKVDITVTTIDQLMGIIRDLRARSMIQGQDFDFAYHPVSSGHSIVSYDPLDNELNYPDSYASFGFYNEKYATMFMLKYGHLIKRKETNEDPI
jgi:hypothetical protein